MNPGQTISENRARLTGQPIPKFPKKEFAGVADNKDVQTGEHGAFGGSSYFNKAKLS